MSTLFVEALPEVQEWLERRRALGQDKRDEMWEGVYHVAPFEHPRNGMVTVQLVVALDAMARSAGLIPGGSFNLGEKDDFRVPDLGYHWRLPSPGAYVPTAALVVEVLSPGDETFAKFDFYAARGVEELWVVDPLERSVRVWQQQERTWQETGRSDLLGTTAAQVEGSLDWTD